MSNYNWCHNPDCHKISTQSRVRGSGDNKVLRTVKIKVYQPETPHIYDFFCNNNCLFQFLDKFATEIANTYSVKQPSETPIKVKKEKYESYRHEYNGTDYKRVPYMATRTILESNNE